MMTAKPPLGAALAFFLGCLAVSVWAASVGWSHTILDQHGFRQTQTAIAAYRLLQGSAWLAYETPVMGPPWSIPFEFPFYQWVVVAVVRLLSLPLDQAGRLVSLLFFYASLPAAYLLLGRFEVRPAHRLLMLGLWLVSPEYLFWSRTFMIESTALCLGLWYLAATAAVLDRPRWMLLALAAVCGSLGAAVKVTTMPGIMLVGAALALHAWSRRRLPLPRLLAVGLACFGLPVAAAAVWGGFADAHKALNPTAASFLLSSQLMTWNFGTLGMRFDPLFWDVMLRRTLPDAIGDWRLLLPVLVGLGFAARRRREAAACFALFLSVPLIFTNLHWVHNYYPYANELFAVAFAGFAVVALLERDGWRAVAGTALLLLVAATEVWAYSRGYYLAQRENQTLAVAEVVREITEPDDVVVIYGMDWSSAIPYYAQRRALMDRANRQFGDPIMRAALEKMQGYRVGAAVFCRYTASHQGLIEQARQTFDLAAAPLARATMSGGQWCDVYGRPGVVLP